MDQACAFCGETALLRDSHVLPAFLYRWLRGRSATGHIRHTELPNRRVQDGLKLKWLCDSCEGRFSRHETKFANEVFHPSRKGQERASYGDWLLKFCVSVSWRVLRFARGYSGKANYTPEQELLMDRAEAQWRKFLNGDVPHPAEFEQHLIVFDIIADTSVADLPTNINRFLTGAITLDIVGSDKSLMTFAKMGPFVLFGIIQRGENRWEGTKVHVRQGVLKPGTFVIPTGVLDLLREKAINMALSMNSMSASQRDKIERYILDHPDEFKASEQYRAMSADLEMFGPAALTSRVEP